MHTEDDVTYTTTRNPIRKIASDDNKYHFMFQLNHKYNLSLPLLEGTTLLFSSRFLTHRQSCTAFVAIDDMLFFSYASYANEKLYNHKRKSFIHSGF